MNIISLALFGEDEKYRNGLVNALKSAHEHYSDWQIVVYCDQLNYDVLQTWNMPHKHVSLTLQKSRSNGVEGMSWRLLASTLPQANAVIFRDADSIFTAREREAVDEWLASSRDVHLIRDHPYHVSLVMGGMFGVRGKAKNILAFLVSNKMASNRLTEYGDDQVFLSLNFYPKIKKTALVHTNSIRYIFEYTLPLRLERGDEQFIGAYAHLDQKQANEYAHIKKKKSPQTLAPPSWDSHRLLKFFYRKFPINRIKYRCKWCW